MFSPQHGAPAPAAGLRTYAQTHAISYPIRRCWPSADLTTARGGGSDDMKSFPGASASVFNTSWLFPMKRVIAVYHIYIYSVNTTTVPCRKCMHTEHS